MESVENSEAVNRSNAVTRLALKKALKRLGEVYPYVSENVKISKPPRSGEGEK